MATVLKRSALSVALAVALGSASPLALAQSSNEAELEARIAELEATVKRLAGMLEQQQMEVQKVVEAAPPPPPANPIQATTITPSANPNTAFSFGGFIKVDSMWTNTDSGELADGSVGRLFYLPQTIPVGGADESTDLDAHAQFSRVWFATNTTLDSGDKLRSYVEMDFFGNALGNEQSTNTYGATVRHLFFGWNNWLAGQTWSNFQDVGALPDAVDFVGPTEGTTFVRQAQIRYTNGPWSISLENPETTLNAFGGGGRISSDDNSVPDVTLRYLHKGDWGHFTIAGVLRQLKYETTTGIEDDTFGGGISVSGKYNLGKNDIRYMVNAGSGIGRYLGLGFSNDATLDANGNLDAIDGWSGFVAYRHVFSPKLRGNLMYSVADYDTDIVNQGGGANDSAQSFHANLIYSPLPKVDIGAELILGEREVANGADGGMTRLHVAFKYSF